MSGKIDIVWPIEPHTEAKHEILRYYLGAWFPILASAHRRLLYVDGFAGPREYIKGRADRSVRKPDGSLDMEREHSDVVHDLLAFLAERIIELNKEKQAESKGFLSWLENYIGAKVEDLARKTKIKTYYESSWEEFYEALKANKRKITVLDISRRQPQETIKSEFESSLAKLNPILKQLELTDKLIDQIVYKLYPLKMKFKTKQAFLLRILKRAKREF